MILALASDGADAGFAVHGHCPWIVRFGAVNSELKDRGRIITHRRELIIPHC